MASAAQDNKRFKLLTVMLGPVVGAIVGATLGVGGTIAWSRWDHRLRELEYYVVSSSAIFKKPEFGKSIEVLVDKQPVENISTVRIEVFNRSTGQDYTDVPVNVVFKAPIGKPPPVILDSNVSDRGDAPVVRAEPDMLDANVTQRSYMVKIANRSDKPVFQAVYYFSGAETPEIDVAVPMKGVRLVPGTAAHATFGWPLVTGIVGGSFAGVVMVLGNAFFAYKFGRTMELRRVIRADRERIDEVQLRLGRSSSDA